MYTSSELIRVVALVLLCMFVITVASGSLQDGDGNKSPKKGKETFYTWSANDKNKHVVDIGAMEDDLIEISLGDSREEMYAQVEMAPVIQARKASKHGKKKQVSKLTKKTAADKYHASKNVMQ